MRSQEGLLDLKNEIHVVSCLGRAWLLLPPVILEDLSTGDELQLLSLGPIYLLRHVERLFGDKQECS